jgi:hypothetical protein
MFYGSLIDRPRARVTLAGMAVCIEEWQMDSATALAGSGPAYVYQVRCAAPLLRPLLRTAVGAIDCHQQQLTAWPAVVPPPVF